MGNVKKITAEDVEPYKMVLRLQENQENLGILETLDRLEEKKDVDCGLVVFEHLVLQKGVYT